MKKDSENLRGKSRQKTFVSTENRAVKLFQLMIMMFEIVSVEKTSRT